MCRSAILEVKNMNFSKYSILILFLLGIFQSGLVNGARKVGPTIRVRPGAAPKTCGTKMHRVLAQESQCNTSRPLSDEERCEYCEEAAAEANRLAQAGCSVARSLKDRIQKTLEGLCAGVDSGGSENAPETESDGSFKWRR